MQVILSSDCWWARTTTYSSRFSGTKAELEEWLEAHKDEGTEYGYDYKAWGLRKEQFWEICQTAIMHLEKISKKRVVRLAFLGKSDLHEDYGIFTGVKVNLLDSLDDSYGKHEEFTAYLMNDELVVKAKGRGTLTEYRVYLIIDHQWDYLRMLSVEDRKSEVKKLCRTIGADEAMDHPLVAPLVEVGQYW